MFFCFMFVAWRGIGTEKEINSVSLLPYPWKLLFREYFFWHEIFFNLPLKCWSLVWTFYLGAFKMLLWVGEDMKNNRFRVRRDYFNFLEELWKAKKIRVFKTRVIFLWFNGKFLMVRSCLQIGVFDWFI